MNKENKITLNNLIYALLFLVFGIILLTSKEDLITISSKVIGILLIVAGIVKSIVYIYMKGKLGDYKLSELLVGLLVIFCGVLFVLYSNALSFAIRIIVGLWIILSGINRIILSINIRSIDKSGFKMFLITSIIMITVGVLLISGVFDTIIGVFIIIYSISEIVDYIYYKVKYKNFDDNENLKKQKKISKLKNKKVVDAVVDEES